MALDKMFMVIMRIKNNTVKLVKAAAAAADG